MSDNRRVGMELPDYKGPQNDEAGARTANSAGVLDAEGAEQALPGQLESREMSKMLATEICVRFDLGDLTGTPQRITRGHANKKWKVETCDGTFLVKEFKLDEADLEGSVPRLERGYMELEKPICSKGDASGVRVPRPVPVPGEERAVAVIDGKNYRVHEWLENQPLEDEDFLITPEIARKMGGIVAAIHREAPVSGEAAASNPPFTEQRWHDTAVRLQGYAATLSDSAAATDMLEAADLLDKHAPLLVNVHDLTYIPTPPGTRILCHGDLHPGNALLCEDGVIAVCDWDRPLAVIPELELIATAGNFATTPDNSVDSDRLMAGIEGYLEASGQPILPQPWIFGLWVDTWARWAEYHTGLHRFAEEPEKFNPPTCLRTMKMAVNLFATIQREHQGWLYKIADLNAQYSRA